MSSPEPEICHAVTDETVTARLEQARRAGASRARRIQVPCLVVGVIGTVSLAALASSEILAGTIEGSLLIAGFVACCAVLLLATLPNQTHVIRVVAVMSILCCTLLMVSVSLLSYGELFEGVGCEKGGPRWARHVLTGINLTSTAVGTVLPVCYIARVLMRREPGLVLLQVLWRCLAFVGPWVAFSFCLGFPFEVMCEAMDLARAVCITATSVLLLAAVGWAASRPEFRAACQAWLARTFGREDAAAGLAALIGGMPVDKVLAAAQRNFRCVQLDRVLDGDMAGGRPDPSLRDLSEPAALDEVDAFLTHSWHDVAEEKWAALQRWRAHFRAEHGREPRVWIDKYCIDQRRIEESLAGLPVFLAGCKQLVVFPGSTYASRLWCVIELLTFISMGGRVEDIVSVPFQSFSMDWSAFDVSGASCVDPRDTARLLAVLEGFAGTRARFNKLIRELFAAAHGADLPPPPGSAGADVEAGTVYSGQVRRSYV